MTFSKKEVFIGPGTSESLERPNNGVAYKSFTGIDLFANIVKHEKVHVKQIADADALLKETTGIWAKGWAWRFEPNNPDDTLNNRYNPGLPEENLDMDNNFNPDIWGANYPGLEQEAQAAEAIPNDTNKGLDWSSPGKQHATQHYND